MYSVVLVTCSQDDAEEMAEEVLRLRLAACVNILGNVRSRYRWKGRLESADESLLLIKTRTELFGKLAHAIKRVHRYEVPETIELRIARGNKAYLDWIGEETRTAAVGTNLVPRRRAE
jgi:periplasmic divalent cation tolerance protein